MARKASPTLPDITVVREVIRLARAVNASNRNPPESEFPRWMPERVALFEYLSRQPDDRMAELHALFWLGSSPSSTARGYAGHYRHAVRYPDDGAYYLTMKPLVHTLTRGLQKLGL